MFLITSNSAVGQIHSECRMGLDFLLFWSMCNKDAYWTNLTPEKAFLARVFVDCCISKKADRRLEAALPVVTSLAFRIQGTYNELCEDIQAEQADNLLGGVEEEERARREDERLDKEFVIAEMCKLAINLDYADEIGRRKMFQLVRECSCLLLAEWVWRLPHR
jgi:condensin complex subunit 3